MDLASIVERLSELTDVCMAYLTVPNASSNTIQSMTPHPMLEKKLMKVSIAAEVLWEEMDAFMRSLEMA